MKIQSVVMTIKTKEWTIRVYDPLTDGWYYEVLRGNPTLRQVVYAVHNMGK